MLSTIINAIVGIQEISVRFMNGIEPLYTGEAREFLTKLVVRIQTALFAQFLRHRLQMSCTYTSTKNRKEV